MWVPSRTQMQNDLTESVQASIRPGEMKDLYYPGETNVCKQAYPSVVTTRFVQNFTQLGAGSSQFVVSPSMGVSDIVLSFTLPTTASGANYTNAALGSGWGYSLINRVSVRYGSSAQYFFTSSQIWLQNVMDAENNGKADQMLQIGGQTGAGAAAASAGGLSGAQANVYLKLPHNSCRASGKPLPFPTDLLVQPIVITVELFSLQQVIINQTGGATAPLATAPTALAAASMCVKQEMLTDSSDLLARRVDMNSHAMTFPLPYFAQQEALISFTSSANNDVNFLNLTGFRAGEVKHIVLWLTPTSLQSTSTGNYQPLVWQPMSDIQLTYNGEVFNRFDASSFQLWNAVEDTKVPAVNGLIQPNYGAAGNATLTPSPYVRLDLAQVSIPSERESVLVHGKPVLNAVVGVQFRAPAASTSYILHAMYLYNASLLCSRGSAEYVF